MVESSARTRRNFLRVLLLGSGATLLAACQQAAPTAPTAAPAKPAAAPTTAPARPAAAATTAPAAAAKPAAAPTQAPAQAAKPSGAAPTGRLVIAQGVDPRSLWANASTAQQEINVAEQFNEKLIEFTPDANEYEPRLATEWKQVDDTTLEMKLRQGVKFTNGEEFDSASAKFSIDEVLIKAPSYVSFANMIAGAEVVDKYTIRVKTKSPTLLHMPALAMGSFQYPKGYYAQLGPDEFGKKPVGTGPYKFVEWVKDSNVTMEANTEYWNGAPPVKTVIFRNIPEGAARLAGLEAGEIDFTIDVPLDAVERIERNPNLALFSRPSNRIFSLTMSTLTDTALKNPRVRQGMQHAVDVPALIQGLFKGRAKQLQGQNLVPAFFGFDPDRKAAAYDPELAKKMFAEAGFPNGFDITFKYSSGRYAQDKEAGQAISAQLAKVGVRARQEVLESGTFLTQLTSKQLNDMYLGGSLPPPDAHFMYQQYESTFRYAYYNNPKIDELIPKGASTANREERLKVYREIQAIFDQDPPYVPLFHPDDFYAGKKALTGFTPRASQYIDVRTMKV